MNTLIFSVPFILDIGGAIKDFFMDLLENYVFVIFYYIEIALLYVLKLLENLMMVFTGEAPVTYNGNEDSLLNVFFSHDSVRGVYMGIGMVGIAFAFAFAIVSVIRKMFDSRGKYQSLTMGTILGNLLKSILIIFGMNAILLVAVNATNILLQAVSDSFILSNDLLTGAGNVKEFSDEEYAAMGRILNTVGNYSLNPSYRSRYNLNACYNDIRTDLKYLGDRGMFSYHYVSMDENEKEVVTWQSIMEELGTAYNYNTETTLDSYDDGLTNAILDTMEIIKQNPNIRVLKSYQGTTHEYTGRVSLDRIMFLVGTMGTINTAAARNDVYNKDPNFYDNIRAPFYYGSKDMYSFSDVKKVFSVSPLKMNYLIVYVGGYEIAMEMMVVIVTCGVRLFNLLALYLIAPLAISTMPMDDGAKFKQWTTAFIVQLLSVVGMVVAIRLFILLLPLIWSPALTVGNTSIGLDDFSDATSTEGALSLAATLLNLLMTMILKIVLTYTAVQAISKVNGIFTGILADNAGFQAVSAGDMRGEFGRSGIGKFMSKHKPVGGDNSQKKEKNNNDKKAEKKNNNDKKGGGAGGGEGSGEGGAGGGGKEEALKKKASDLAGNAKANANRNKDMKMLDAAVKHGQETGRRMDGKKLSKDGKDLAVMKGTLDHMKKDGMNLKDAKAAAEKDYQADKQKKDADNKFHQKELKAGPPNRNKAEKQASKMKDHDYKAMKRDLAFMKENGYHANGDAIKPGERGQMEETLKAYENRQRNGGAGGKNGSGSKPMSQNKQVGGKGGAGSAAGNAAGAAAKAVGNTAGAAAKAVGNTAGAATKAVGNTAGAATKAATNTAGAAAKTTANTAGAATKATANAAGAATKATANTAGAAAKATANTAGAVAKGVGNTVGEAAKGIGNVPDNQSSQIGGSTGAGESDNTAGSIPDNQSSQIGGSTGAGESDNTGGSVPDNQSGQIGGSTGAGESDSTVGSIPDNQSSQIGGNEDIPDNIDTSNSINDYDDGGSIPDNQSSQISEGYGEMGSESTVGSIPDNQSSQISEGYGEMGSESTVGSIPDNQSSQISGGYGEMGSESTVGSVPDNQSGQISGGSANMGSDSTVGSIPNNQSSQIGGSTGASESGSTVGSVPNNQSSQISGGYVNMGSDSTAGSVPNNQSSQIAGGGAENPSDPGGLSRVKASPQAVERVRRKYNRQASPQAMAALREKYNIPDRSASGKENSPNNKNN